MFFPEGQVRVFLYGQPVTFDGLYALAKHVMHKDPLSGHLFAFINRRATQIRVLYLDRTGLRVWASVSNKVGSKATGPMSQAAKWTGRASNFCSKGSSRNRCASATKTSCLHPK